MLRFSIHITTRGMLYCMASHVSGGAKKATIASRRSMTPRPASSAPSRRESRSSTTCADSRRLDGGCEDSRGLDRVITNVQARMHARSQLEATAPRVNSDLKLSSSVVATTQTPHKAPAMRKLARHSFMPRQKAVQHPKKANKGSSTNALSRLFVIGASHYGYCHQLLVLTIASEGCSTAPILACHPHRTRKRSSSIDSWPVHRNSITNQKSTGHAGRRLSAANPGPECGIWFEAHICAIACAPSEHARQSG